MTNNQLKSTDYLLYQSDSSLGILNDKLIKISQNSIIAIITSNGVCLMKSDNEWNEAINYRQYYKFIIPNPKETFIQCLHKTLKINYLNYTTEQIQKIYLDHTLFPQNNATTYKAFRDLEWSHGNCINNEPLLALLSMEHELCIYGLDQVNNSYESLINVSSILLENYPKTHKSKHNLSYDSLKDLIYSTAITKVCWTEFVQSNEKLIMNNSTDEQDKNENNSNECSTKSNRRTSKRTIRRTAKSPVIKKKVANNQQTSQINDEKTINFCLLITLSKNGIVYFFKINQTDSNVDCMYLNEWQPDLHIKNIFYSNKYLILIYTNGQIELIYFEIDLFNLDQTNFDFENLIKQRIVLWTEEDQINVDDLLLYERNSLIYFVCVKTNFIILKILENVKYESEKRRRTDNVRSMNYDSEGTNSTNNQIINHQNNHLQIKKSLVEEGIFKMSVSGLCKLYNDDLLVSSTDGYYYRIEITDNFKIKQKKFNFPGLTSENYCPISLCSTKDGYLCCTISYICVYFDHLQIRDSTRFIVFTPLTREEVFKAINNLIETKEDSINFKNLYNLLECFKIYMLSNEKFNFDFKSYSDQKELDNLTDLNLKVLRFALLCQESNSKKVKVDETALKFTFDEQDAKNSNNNDKVNLNEKSVNKTSVEKNQEITSEQAITSANQKQLNKLKNTKDENPEQFIDLMKKIEKLLNKRYFSKLKANHSRTNLNGEQQESINLISNYLNNKTNTKEQCSICEKKSIKLTNYDSAECSNGHRFARCSYSLLICDLSKYNYKLCSFCKKYTFIHPFIWSSNQNSFYCLYCC